MVINAYFMQTRVYLLMDTCHQENITYVIISNEEQG